MMLENNSSMVESLEMNAVISHKKQLEETKVMENERKLCKLKL